MIYVANIATAEPINSIEDCLFENNNLVLDVENLGVMYIIRCNFTKNNGGAIYLEQFGTISINTCKFSNNFVSSNGGGIFAFNSQSNSILQIISTIFVENNSANYGGALY